MSKKDMNYRVAGWNMKRGLNEFDRKRALRMILEEILELATNDKEKITTIVDGILENIKLQGRSIEDTIDTFDDIIIYCCSEKVKVYSSINPNATTEELALLCRTSINRVMDANDKKGLERNEQGKIIKSKNFVEPITPLTLDDLTIEERAGCCCKCKEEHDDAGQLK